MPGQQEQVVVNVQAKDTGDELVYPGVVLTPGVYQPAMGNPLQLRILFGSEFLRRVTPSFEGQPINLDHKHDTENEVGHLRNLQWDDKIRADLHLVKDRPRFDEAVSFVESRLKRGEVPNVSPEFRDQVMGLVPEGGDWDAEIADGTGAGLAILPEGACTPEDGCGIGLQRDNQLLMLGAYDPSGSTDHEEPGREPGQEQDDNKRKGTKMADDDGGGQGAPSPDGAGKPCSCGGAPSLQTVRAEAETARQKAKDLEEKQTELQGLLDAEKKAREEADGKVEAFQEAEHKATLEALEKEAKDQGLEVKEVVGEEPTTEQATVALKALQLSGAKAQKRMGLRGRATNSNPRDGAGGEPQGGQDAQLRSQQLERARVRMGLSKPESSGHLPHQMARRRPWLNGQTPDKQAKPEGGDQDA